MEQNGSEDDGAEVEKETTERLRKGGVGKRSFRQAEEEMSDR